MMLEWSFGQTTEARTIERAVTRALNGGAATRDLGGTHSTTQVADAVIAAFAVA
jgi:isocitrate/isopropylmalate dehydrogenase